MKKTIFTALIFALFSTGTLACPGVSVNGRFECLASSNSEPFNLNPSTEIIGEVSTVTIDGPILAINKTMAADGERRDFEEPNEKGFTRTECLDNGDGPAIYDLAFRQALVDNNPSQGATLTTIYIYRDFDEGDLVIDYNKQEESSVGSGDFTVIDSEVYRCNN